MSLLCLSMLLVSLELLSRRLPGAGSTSISYLAALALLATAGPGPASLIAACGWLLGSLLVKPHPIPKTAFSSAFTEFAPKLCGLGASFFIPGLTLQLTVASVLYVLLSLLLPGAVASQLPAEIARGYLTVQSRMSGLRVATCSLGGLLGWLLTRSQFEAALLLLPVIWQLQRGLELNTQLEEQIQRADVVSQLNQSRQSLEETRQEKLHLGRDLSRQQREYQTLELSAAAMLQVQDPSATAEKIVKLCLALAPLQSIVVFLRQSDQLIPIQPHTPHLQRLQERILLGLEEPMLGEALRTNTPQLRPIGKPEHRVFQDEEHALAFPLGQLGVLYLGRKQSFSQAEFTYLAQAAWTAGSGILAALQMQELKDNLEQRQRLADQLSSWSAAIEVLLQCSTQFLQHLHPGQLEQTLEKTVEQLFPCDRIQVSLSGKCNHPAGQEVRSSRLPLLVEDLKQTRWHSPADWQVALLIVPILHPEMVEVGLITLESKTPGVFHRQHLSLLSILASLAAVAGKNAELHSETLATQAQLVQSSKLAAVGQLAAGIAHELNTPLASIALNCDMLGRILAKPELDANAARSRLDRILDSMTRAQSIANKLLYYCREGNSGLRPVCPQQLIHDTLEFLTPSLHKDGVQIECEIQKTEAVMANSNELQQVLINLLINARDAVKTLDEPRRLVKIQVAEIEGELSVRVLDRGEGIAPEVQSRILEPFFTTKAVGEGTGLGLSISQQIVSSHGGKLHFSSQPGQGSCFEMLLPLARTN